LGYSVIMGFNVELYLLPESFVIQQVPSDNPICPVLYENNVYYLPMQNLSTKCTLLLE
jgi:hypothetical protein